MSEDAVFGIIIFLCVVLFWGTPDLHDALVEWVRTWGTCK